MNKKSRPRCARPGSGRKENISMDSVSQTATEYKWPKLIKGVTVERLLGISRETLNRLARDGEVEYVDYYGQRRYIEESVIACFERHKAKPKEQWPEVIGV